MGEPAGQKRLGEEAKAAADRAKRYEAQQQKIAGTVEPFLTALAGLGLDVNSFKSSPLGQAILGQMTGGISQEYGAARNLLAENLGSAGLTGSGVGTGPMANLFRGEATAKSNALSQIPITGLQLGMSGIEGLMNQEQLYNPNVPQGQAIGGYAGMPQGGFWQGFTGSLGSKLGEEAGKAPGKIFGGLFKSDLNSKENFALVNGDEVLARLAKIPVLTWNYKEQDASIRHLGPMAQDFYAAFRVGEDEKHINMVDASGVSLAAIQALYSRLLTEVAKLRDEMKEIGGK